MFKTGPFFFPCSSVSPVECEKREEETFSSPSDYCSSPVDENEEFLATLSGQPRQKMVPIVDKSPLQRALNEVQFATANSTISATDAILRACGMLIASHEQHLAEALECIQRHISASSHDETLMVSAPREQHESTITPLYCAPIIPVSFLKRVFF